MADNDLLAEQFEEKRRHLRGVAYRMLGSLAEADDAVQEAWLRLSRSGGGVDNLGAWLTTVVARVCLEPRGKLLMVLKFTVAEGKIVEMEAIGDRDRLRRLDLAVLGEIEPQQDSQRLRSL